MKAEDNPASEIGLAVLEGGNVNFWEIVKLFCDRTHQYDHDFL